MVTEIDMDREREYQHVTTPTLHAVVVFWCGRVPCR
jgi:hypothetical protein